MKKSVSQKRDLDIENEGDKGAQRMMTDFISNDHKTQATAETEKKKSVKLNTL